MRKKRISFATGLFLGLVSIFSMFFAVDKQNLLLGLIALLFMLQTGRAIGSEEDCILDEIEMEE